MPSGNRRNFSYGANIKVIREDMAEFGATGVGFDIGLSYRPLERLFLGANLQDITTTLDCVEHRQKGAHPAHSESRIRILH